MPGPSGSLHRLQEACQREELAVRCLIMMIYSKQTRQITLARQAGACTLRCKGPAPMGEGSSVVCQIAGWGRRLPPKRGGFIIKANAAAAGTHRRRTGRD